MAQLGKAHETQTRSALTDAAERLDRLARVVKDQQLAETRSGPRIALNDAYVASPEEAWAKKFMTQAIGPAVTSLQPAVTLPPIQPVLPNQGFVATPPKTSGAAPEVRPGAQDRAIGGAIGKPMRRRSWLGRLFRGN